MDLILASTSTYRRALVERLGIPFRTVRPDVDEDAFKSRFSDPERLAGELAIAKALAVSRHEPDSVIIGGDQVVAVGGEILSKPGTAECAELQLEKLAGRAHRLYTAIAVCHDGRTETALDISTLQMRPLALDEIKRYVAADSPLDCAGGYKIESRGIALFEKIESADQTAIQGIPMMALASLLRGAGFSIP